MSAVTNVSKPNSLSTSFLLAPMALRSAISRDRDNKIALSVVFTHIEVISKMTRLTSAISSFIFSKI